MTDINLKYLIVKNFKKLSDFELTFVPNSLTLIKGSNGSGKSSIFEAIYTCLYGSLSGTTDSEVIQKGKQSATIELGIEIDGETYKIERTLGKGPKIIITKTDLVISDKSSLSKSIIEKLIPEFVVKISMLQARSKNEIKTLIKDVVTSILNIDDFFEKLKNKITDLNQDIINKKNEFAKIEINRNNLSSYIDEMQTRIKRTEQDILEQQTKIKEYEIQLNGIVIEELVELSNSIGQEYNNRLNSITKTLTDEYQSINNVIQEFKTKLNQLDMQRNNILNTAKLEGQKIDNHILGLVSNLEKQIHAIDMEIRNKTNDISHKTTELSVDKCPVCKQTISSDIKEEVKVTIEKLKNELVPLKATREDLSLQVTQQKGMSASMKQDAIKGFSEQLLKIKQEYDYIATTELDALNNKLGEVGNKINSIDKQNIYNSVLEDYKVDRNLIENSQTYINLHATKKSLMSKVDVLNDEISYNVNKIKEYNTEVQSLVTKLSSTQTETDTISTNLSHYEYWNDSRLLKNILLKKVSNSINTLLKDKYQSVMSINFELGERDIDIKVTNLNGEEVHIENLSQGEFAITILSIICTFKELISVKYNFSWLILDEFLDRLDNENMSSVIQFLSEKIEGSKFVITHNSYALDSQTWDNVIDMSN